MSRGPSCKPTPLLSRLKLSEKERTPDKQKALCLELTLKLYSTQLMLTPTYSKLSPKMGSTAFRLSQCFSVWLLQLHWKSHQLLATVSDSTWKSQSLSSLLLTDFSKVPAQENTNTKTSVRWILKFPSSYFEILHISKWPLNTLIHLKFPLGGRAEKIFNFIKHHDAKQQL